MTEKKITDLDLETWRDFRRLGELIPALIGQEISNLTGLSTSEFRVLMELSRVATMQKLQQKDVQEILGWEKSRLSHLLNRMEKRMLIRRTASTKNSQLIEITDEGKRLLDEAMPVRDVFLRKYFLDLLTDDEKQVLSSIFKKIKLHVDDA